MSYLWNAGDGETCLWLEWELLSESLTQTEHSTSVAGGDKFSNCPVFTLINNFLESFGGLCTAQLRLDAQFIPMVIASQDLPASLLKGDPISSDCLVLIQGMRESLF